MTTVDADFAVYIYDNLKDLWSDTPSEAYYCELQTIFQYQHIKVDNDTNPDDYIIQNNVSNTTETTYSKMSQILEAGLTYYIVVKNLEEVANADHYRFSLYIKLENSARQLIQTKKNQSVYVFVTAKNVSTFAGKQYSISYDPAELHLEAPNYFAIGNNEIQVLPGMDSIDFKVNKAITPGKTFTGTISILKFIALKDGESEISMFIDNANL